MTGGSSHVQRIGGRRKVGPCVVLYTTAECWRGASVSFVHIARGLAERGYRAHVLSMWDDVTREFARAGIPVSDLSPGRAEAWRLRRALRALDAELLLVDRSHDLRVGTL